MAIHGRGTWYCKGKGLGAGMRKDWGGIGCAIILREMGGWSCRLTLESGSQSQTAGLDAGLFSNIWFISWCWKLLLLPKKTKLFWLTGTLSPSFPDILLWAPCPPFGITPGHLCISSSLLLCATTANRRGHTLPIDDLPVDISFQSPISN